jgi:hypothetical protein
MLRHKANELEDHPRLHPELWTDLRLHSKQIEVLLGSSVQKPPRWNDLHQHMPFRHVDDLDDIEEMDWPRIKDGLRRGLYGINEALPVRGQDLSELVAAKPTDAIATELAWSKLDDDGFERRIGALSL